MYSKRLNKIEMDYKNGKIYQLLNNNTNDVYVGSTTQPLCKILHQHKSKSTRYTNHFYEKMRDIGIEHFYIELIELYPCKSKEELRAREGHYIRERGTLNKIIAGRTQKQYNEEHIEIINEVKTQYNEKQQRNNKGAQEHI